MLLYPHACYGRDLGFEKVVHLVYINSAKLFPLKSYTYHEWSNLIISYNN